MWTWLLVGWPVAGAFGLTIWASRQKADPAIQVAEDAEQMAYLQAYRAAQNARLRKDPRAKHVTQQALEIALHGKLADELGRKWGA